MNYRALLVPFDETKIKEETIDDVSAIQVQDGLVIMTIGNGEGLEIRHAKAYFSISSVKYDEPKLVSIT